MVDSPCGRSRIAFDVWHGFELLAKPHKDVQVLENSIPMDRPA